MEGPTPPWALKTAPTCPRQASGHRDGMGAQSAAAERSFRLQPKFNNLQKAQDTQRPTSFQRLTGSISSLA